MTSWTITLLIVIGGGGYISIAVVEVDISVLIMLKFCIDNVKVTDILSMEKPYRLRWKCSY